MVQGLNAALYYENTDFKNVVSLVPTSAITGEGIPDLLLLVVQLTQQMMSRRLMFMNYVEATVLEVKTVDGLGTTIDVVLVNGALHKSDTIVVCGMSGPIVTPIRALLTPQPLKEIRVKVRTRSWDATCSSVSVPPSVSVAVCPFGVLLCVSLCVHRCVPLCVSCACT